MLNGIDIREVADFLLMDGPHSVRAPDAEGPDGVSSFGVKFAEYEDQGKSLNPVLSNLSLDNAR